MNTPTASPGWHLTPADLDRYTADGSAGEAGGLDPVLAASIEAHLIKCPACRQSFSDGLGERGRTQTERRWAELAAVVDRPPARPLARLGISTGPLRGAWAAALGLLLLGVAVPAFFMGGVVAIQLLALAPLAPMAAVALSYRTTADPAGEIALAAPIAGLRVVSLRSLAVGAGAVPLGLGAFLLLGEPWQVALVWLLPGLALAALVLLAGTTRLDPTAVAGALGVVWSVGVATPAATRRTSIAEVVGHASDPTLQLTALAVAVLALAVAYHRRERVAYRRTT